MGIGYGSSIYIHRGDWERERHIHTTYTQHGQHSSEKHSTSVDEEIGVKTG